MAAAIKEVVGDDAIREGRVTLDLPPLVENGNTVPLTVSVESPMTPGRPRQGDPRLQREEPAAARLRCPARPAQRPGRGRHAHQARRFAEDRRHRRDQQGRVLERQRRRDRHARGLHRGHDYDQCPDQRAQDGQEGRGRRDQGADPASDGDRLPAGHQRPHHPAQHHRALHRDLERRGDLPHGVLAGDRRQPVRVVLRGGDGERHHRASAGPATKASLVEDQVAIAVA